MASVDYVLGFALSSLGLVAAGALAKVLGVRTTLLIGGGLTALTTMIPFLPGREGPNAEQGILACLRQHSRRPYVSKIGCARGPYPPTLASGLEV